MDPDAPPPTPPPDTPAMPLGRAVTERFGWHRRIRTRPRPTIGRLAVAATSFGSLVGRPISTRRVIGPATPADAPQSSPTVAFPLSPALAAWWRFARDGETAPPSPPRGRPAGADDPDRPPARGLPRAIARASRSPMGNGTGPAGAGVRFSSRSVPVGRDPEVAAVGPILTTRETELASSPRSPGSGPQAHGRTPDRTRPPTAALPPVPAVAPGRPRLASPTRPVPPGPGVDRLAASRPLAPRAGDRAGARPASGPGPGTSARAGRTVAPLAAAPAGATATLVRSPSARLASAPPGAAPETGPDDPPGAAWPPAGGRLATLRVLSAHTTAHRATHRTPDRAAVPASPPRPPLVHAQLHRRATLARRASQVVATHTLAAPLAGPAPPPGQAATRPSTPVATPAGLGATILAPAPAPTAAGVRRPEPAPTGPFGPPGVAGPTSSPAATNVGDAEARGTEARGAEARDGTAGDGAASPGSLADWGTLARTADRLEAAGPGRTTARRTALGQVSAPLGSLTAFGPLLGPWMPLDGTTPAGARLVELASPFLHPASAVAIPLPGTGGAWPLRTGPGTPARGWAPVGEPGAAGVGGGGIGALGAARSLVGGRAGARRTFSASAPTRRASTPTATSARIGIPTETGGRLVDPASPSLHAASAASAAAIPLPGPGAPESAAWPGTPPSVVARRGRPPGHGTRGGTPALRRERPTAARFLDALAARRPDPATILPHHLRPLAAAIAGPAPVTVRSGPASTAALAAVGKEAATIDRVIHLAAPPGRSPRQAEIVAHELVHAARPSATPRFFDDDHASGEENLARRVGGLARSLAGTDGRTPKNPNLTWGTGRLPVSPRPFSGSAGTGPVAPRPGPGGEPFGGTGGVGAVLGAHRRSGAPTGRDLGDIGAVLGAHRRSGAPTGGDLGGVGTGDPVDARPRRPETPAPFRRPPSPVRADRTGGPFVDPDPTPPLVGTPGPPLPPETLEWIIDRIEQHVIDELERRGLRHNPGVF